MRHPTYASLRLATRWAKLDWGYDRPIPLQHGPGFYTQGCTWFEVGPLRLAVVWSNPQGE